MCLVETGDVVVVQRQRTGGKVFDKMAPTAGPGDQQHVVSDRQHPREGDLGWSRAVAGSNTVDNWIGPNGVMLCLRPTQRTERNERDAPGRALLEYWRRRPIRKVVDVLYADDVGDLERHQQVPVSDVADPDARDQTFIPGRYQGAQLIDEPLIGHRVVQHTQVYRRQLLDTERCKVFLDAGAELIGVVVRQPPAGIVASRSNFAHQGQPVGVGEERFTDQRVDHTGPVILGRVDVIDTGIGGGTQYRERFVAIPWRTVDAVAGQLHRPVPDAPYRFVGQAIAIARGCFHRRCLSQRLPASTPFIARRRDSQAVRTER